MKRKIYAMLTASLFLAGGSAIAQNNNVGIGTVSPDASAVLDIQSSNKGLLIPRMSIEQRNLISSPATGLMIYQTGDNAGFFFYNGNTWKPLTDATGDAKSVAFDVDNWGLNGNSVSSTNFIGTTNAQPLRFRISNQNAGIIDQPTGNVIFGYQAGQSITTGVRVNGMGYQALNANTTGSNTVAIGFRALYRNTTGNENFAL